MYIRGLFILIVLFSFSCRQRESSSEIKGTDTKFYSLKVLDLDKNCAMYWSKYHKLLEAKYGLGNNDQPVFDEQSLKANWKDFVAESEKEQSVTRFLQKANGNTLSAQWGRLFLVVECPDTPTKFAWVMKRTYDQKLTLANNIKPSEKVYALDDYSYCASNSLSYFAKKVSDCSIPGKFCKVNGNDGKCTKYNPDPETFKDGDVKPCRCEKIIVQSESRTNLNQIYEPE